MMSRIEGVDPEKAEGQVKAVLQAQAEKWGAPLLTHLLYARRPTVHRGARAMWGDWPPPVSWIPSSSPC